jgi:type IV pilus assembly protein PilA
MLGTKRGFTLIELLMVMLIIGLLAAIVIPKFNANKEKAFVASMKSDLRNLVVSQENYHADNVTFTSSLSALNATFSEGVTLSVAAVTAQGWTATASHTASSKSCAVFIGDAATTAPATDVGEVGCD